MSPEFRKAWILLGLAVLFWGLNWPIMKVGLHHIGPLWFAAFRVLLGAAALFVFLGLGGRLSRPTRSELPILFSVGILQVGGCMALLHSSLLYVEAGRAAVLAYTTPVWAAPLAAVFLHERLTPRKIAGILLGMAGIAAMFSSHLAHWTWNDAALGHLMPLTSALLWAGVIVHIRGHGWKRPHLALLPWQLLLGGLSLSGLAALVEGVPVVAPSLEGLAILVFNGLAATAFSFWAYIGAARVLPANTTALASLSIPVVGLVSATAMLGEPVTTPLLIGLLLIASAIALSSFSGRA